MSVKAVICNSFGPIDSLSLENVEGLNQTRRKWRSRLKQRL